MREDEDEVDDEDGEGRSQMANGFTSKVIVGLVLASLAHPSTNAQLQQTHPHHRQCRYSQPARCRYLLYLYCNQQLLLLLMAMGQGGFDLLYCLGWS